MLIKVIFSLSILATAFVQCTSYKQGDAIPLYYNKVFSLKNRLSYSYPPLSFVCPNNGASRKKSLLVFDEDLRGDRLVQSDYKINMLENQECKVLCRKAWTVEDAIKVEELIADDYLVEWELDDMPGATVSYTNEAPEHNYKVGFPLGFKKGGSIYINNHVIFQILYKQDAENIGNYDIVGFEVYPQSITDGECSRKVVEYENQMVHQKRSTVTFTYSVKWKQVKPSEIESRWDAYLVKPNPDRHTYSTINGVIVTAIVSAIIMLILLKTARKDNGNNTNNVNQDDNKDFKMYDDSDEFIGWKLINRDVFRRPIYGGLLTPVMGSGIQLLIAAFGIIGCLFMGWYHPAEPASLTRWFTFFIILGGIPAGYWSARIYKVFRGKTWLLNSILTSCIVPACFAVVLFCLNIITWSQQSSLALSFSGWASLISLWLFVLVPVTLVGAYFGEKAERIEHPSRTTQIPRIIPAKKWYQLDFIRVALAGIIPFSIIFLNWHELLGSVVKGELYLSIESTVYSSTLMLVVSAQITVVLVFLQLCAEDYLWWWQSFILGASSSLYMFIYGAFYYMQKSAIEGVVGGTIFLSHLFMACALVGLCTGTLSFISTYIIIRRIYSSVKVD